MSDERTPVTVADQGDDGPLAVPDPPARPPGRRARRRPAGPAARFEPGKVAEARHRNPTWLVAGVLLVVLERARRRAAVLVQRRPRRRPRRRRRPRARPADRARRPADRSGSPSTAASRRCPPTPPTRRRPASRSGRVPAGTLLAPGDVRRRACRSAPTRSWSARRSIRARRRCRGWRSARRSSCCASTVPARRRAPTSAASAAASLGTGTVWAVEPIATGQLWVSMRVDRDVGLAASLASAADTLRVVLVGGAG